jgi:hypothetical protein
VTVFAGDDELLAFLHHEPHDRSSIGEVMTKAYTRERGELVESVERCPRVSPNSFPLRYRPTRPVTIRTTAVGSDRIDFDQNGW